LFFFTFWLQDVVQPGEATPIWADLVCEMH
jgi:hypothetical protein